MSPAKVKGKSSPNADVDIPVRVDITDAFTCSQYLTIY